MKSFILSPWKNFHSQLSKPTVKMFNARTGLRTKLSVKLASKLKKKTSISTEYPFRPLALALLGG